MREGERERRRRFDALFASYSSDIVAYCGWRADSASEAQDAAAEVFLTAWRRLDALPEGDAARVWLYATARRVIANQRRSSRRRDALYQRLAPGKGLQGGPLDPCAPVRLRSPRRGGQPGRSPRRGGDRGRRRHRPRHHRDLGNRRVGVDVHGRLQQPRPDLGSGRARERATPARALARCQASDRAWQRQVGSTPGGRWPARRAGLARAAVRLVTAYTVTVRQRLPARGRTRRVIRRAWVA
jgi:hypothetical protein